MAGAGFKDFTAGDILTATQVDEYLMQQTVMRFADSAARTTALSGVLAEGMLSYLNDTNTVQVYNGSAWVNVGGGSPLTTKGDVYTYSTTDARLAVGANDTVLTADSSTATGLKWAAVSGGAYTQLASGTASGATLDLTSISGSYRDLVVIWRNVRPASNGEQLFMRFNSDSTANRHSSTELNDGSSLAFNSTYFTTDGGVNSGATNANTIKVITVYDYANTSTYKFAEVLNINTDETTNTLVDFRRRVGMYNQTGAITALNFFWSGSVNFSGGTYVLYGVK